VVDSRPRYAPSNDGGSMWLMLVMGSCWPYARPGGETSGEYQMGRSESGLHDI
jgi:hypothetical protein